jgi:deoxyribodipyrimidine photo-lyase
MNCLYLFQNDFRLQDNALLNEALLQSQTINFVAFLPEEQWGKWRQKFYLQCLENLDHQLRQFDHTLSVVSKEEFYASDVTRFDRLYTCLINLTNENREREILKSKTKVTSQQTDRLLSQLDFAIPNIYTEFRKKVEKVFSPNPKIQVPAKGQWPKSGPKIFDELSDLKLMGPFDIDKNSAFPFDGGEEAGLKRLHEYLWKDQSILTYKETRNGLLGLNYSTKFSPWLATGCISPHTIYREVEKFEEEIKENQSTYWVKFELWWREYFRWVGDAHGVQLFKIEGFQQKEVAKNGNYSKFNEWVEGRTGQDFVDANMKEIKATGWMSNRGRQNVASYLVKDLNLPWIWGARYFENQLIDYDPWSNYGNWQYVAGVGNDPRPNRYFNLEKQAKVYDPDGTFRKVWN